MLHKIPLYLTRTRKILQLGLDQSQDIVTGNAYVSS